MNRTFLNTERIKNKSGISLTEIIVTIIILGMFAGLALPNYTTTVEKARAGEGVRILEALLAAQRLFHYENGVYDADSTGIGDLDVDIPVLKYFDPPVVDEGDPDPVLNEIAHIDRTGNSYTLSINEEGKIICINDTPPLCTQLGFAVAF